MTPKRGSGVCLAVGLVLLIAGAIWGRNDGGYWAGMLGGVGVVLLVIGAVRVGEP